MTCNFKNYNTAKEAAETRLLTCSYCRSDDHVSKTFFMLHRLNEQHGHPLKPQSVKGSSRAVSMFHPHFNGSSCPKGETQKESERHENRSGREIRLFLDATMNA